MPFRLPVALVFPFTLFALMFARIDTYAENSDSPQTDHVADDSWPSVTFPAPEKRSSAFRPNEKLTFRAGWGIFQSAGQITMKTATEKRNGTEVFTIHTHSTTRGIIRALYLVDTKTLSVVDPVHWRTLESRDDGTEGGDKTSSVTKIDYQTGRLHFEDNIEPKNDRTRKLPYPVAMDFISALFEARSGPMTVGQSFPIFAEGSGKFYLLTITVAERKKIDTPLGTFEAFRLKPSMPYKASGIFARGGGIDLWISDTKLRLPLRVDVQVAVGTARLYLERYQAPGIDLSPKNTAPLVRPRPR